MSTLCKLCTALSSVLYSWPSALRILLPHLPALVELLLPDGHCCLELINRPVAGLRLPNNCHTGVANWSGYPETRKEHDRHCTGTADGVAARFADTIRALSIAGKKHVWQPCMPCAGGQGLQAAAKAQSYKKAEAGSLPCYQYALAALLAVDM